MPRGILPRARIQRAAAGQPGEAGLYIPLAELTSASEYPAEVENVAAFYEESQKLVRFLSAADRKGFVAFLDAMGKGALFETAVRNHSETVF